MESFDEEMLVMAPVCTEQQEQASKEKKFRKTAATMGGIVCLLLVATSATVRGGMSSSAASPLLFNRELQSKGDIFGPAPAPSPSGGSSGGTSSCTQTYTTSDVSKHSSSGDCWVILFDTVYDFTNYLNIHPGGPNAISNNCGKDGTSSYSNIHAPSTVNNKGMSYIKGRVGTTTGQDCGGSTGGTAPAPAPTPSGGGGTPTGSCNVYTASDVAKHSSSGDCWVVIMDVVYDFTNYLNRHPGGASAISNNCGKDGTSAYSRVHSASTVNNKGKGYIKGNLGTTSGSGPCTTTGGTSGGGTTGGGGDDHDEDDHHDDGDHNGGDDDHGDGGNDGGDEDEGDD